MTALEALSNPTFTLGEDETGGPCFFWTNPWSGQKEKVANLWWPTHPVELTGAIEKLFERLQLSAVPASPWRPIETAPIDGTDFDAWTDEGRLTGVFWGTRESVYVKPREGWCVCGHDGWRHPATPTHWMPEPKGPEGV